MRRLIAAEFQKLFTTRLWLWLLLASMALTALYTVLAIVFADSPGNPTPPLSTAGGQQTLLSTASGAATAFVAVLAAIGLTGEFRHRTVSPTFLATPVRSRVLVAKLVTYFLVGAGYAVACLAISTAISVPWLAARNIAIVSEGKAATVFGTVVAVAIFGLIGVGLGALLRDQVATVVTLLVYLFVVEVTVIRISALHDWTKYLPGSAEDSVVGVVQSNFELLPRWEAAPVLVAYGLLLSAAGSMFTMRRDIT